jgi:uncharacterized NAD-dependent epimerase/dehydratase family protein
MLVLRKPYLLYLGDAVLKSDCKTAFGLYDWCGADVIGEWSLPASTVSVGAPRLSAAQAAALGAGSIVVGVAPTGGLLPEHWQDDLEAALHAGLDVVSGLHTRLTAFPRLVRAAEAHGVRLVDVRHSSAVYPVASGRKRSGQRVLTVGTDCALGKKYTALALAQALQAKGHAATFRATGQTGILIAGSGIAVDALVADFLAGAAEEYPDYPIPPLPEVIDAYLQAGRLTNRGIRCVGISINSSTLDAAAWHDYRARLEHELGLPVCDPLRGGVERLAAALVAE